MENTHDDSKKIANDEKHTFKIELALKPNASAGNSKSAESLGNGRWKYQGKTYKEQSIGKGEF